MSVKYIGYDNVKDGDWIGLRGRQAHYTPTFSNIPTGYTIALAGQLGPTWGNVAPTDTYGLQYPANPASWRSGYGWYINTAGYMTATVSVTDSAWHLAAVYCFDNTSSARTSVVEVMDGGTVLGTYSKSNSYQYESYWVLAAFSGSVVFRFSRGNSSSLAPLQGLFVDPYTPHSIGLGQTPGNWLS